MGIDGTYVGRVDDPVIKVRDLAWLRFARPDLDRTETFARAFGFVTAHRSDDELVLRGTLAGGPCVLVRRGPAAFEGLAFAAANHVDLDRLAVAVAVDVTDLPDTIGGRVANLVNPNGVSVEVVHGVHVLAALESRAPLVVNGTAQHPRINEPQRPPQAPARVERLGHLVMETSTFAATLAWYLELFGLIVSDFLYFDGQRDLGPTMAFLRCDRGDEPTDHHTLALTLGPANRYVHSAYQVSDLDSLAAGGEYLKAMGYKRSWGIGRHIQGSQIFDYWRDPDGFLMEHFVDGDLFDASVEAGITTMTASGLAQWGPPATNDFLGIAPGRDSIRTARDTIAALRSDNEFDLTRLRGLLKVASS